MSTPLSFEDALAFRAKLLNEVVCSAAWLEGIVEQDQNGAWRINPDRYPPPGMRACPHCGRICPPSNSDDQWCTDCDGEREELEFVDWAQHSEVKEQLYGLWWRGITYADLIDRGLRLLGEGVAAEPEAAGGPEDRSPIDANRSVPRDEGPQTSCTRDLYVIERDIWKWLAPRRRREGRAPGCRIKLLPDSEQRLRDEIEYFELEGQVAPSVPRLNLRKVRQLRQATGAEPATRAG